MYSPRRWPVAEAIKAETDENISGALFVGRAIFRRIRCVARMSRGLHHFLQNEFSGEIPRNESDAASFSGKEAEGETRPVSRSAGRAKACLPPG